MASSRLRNAAERLSLRCSAGAPPRPHRAFCRPPASAHEKALFALAAVRARRGEHAELQAALLPLAERLGARDEREKAGDVCKRLAVLRRDKLRDAEGAIEAYRAALGCAPGDGDARAMLSELLVAKGENDAATRELVTTARHAPLRAATYKRLFGHL